MNRWWAGVVLMASPVQADVLGLNDYDAMFALEGAEISQLEDGSRVLQLPQGVQVMQSDGRYTSLDTGPLGAVGCFVRILSQIAAYQQACEGPFDADQMGLLEGFLDRSLAFYAANTQPTATLEEARARFDSLVEVSMTNAAGYCSQPGDIATFMQSVLSPQTVAVVDQMLSTPRLPVDNPCL